MLQHMVAQTAKMGPQNAAPYLVFKISGSPGMPDTDGPSVPHGKRWHDRTGADPDR